MLLEGLKIAGKEAAKLNVDLLFVYYSGHGKPGSGDWVCKLPPVFTNDSEYCVGFDEAMDAILIDGYKGRLKLINDACYSGHWSKKALERTDRWIQI
jgi:hypothetical protein